MKLNFEYRAESRRALEGHWNEGAIMALVILAVACVCSGMSVGGEHLTNAFFRSFTGGTATLLNFLISVPLSTAFTIMFLGFLRGENGLNLDSLIAPLRQNFRNIFVTTLIMTVLVSLASIFTLGILGIYLAYCYAMVPFLLRDYPDLEWRDVLRTSREMMNGHKWDYFCLQLSFIGWIFLAICTCGIGLLWVMPYMETAEAAFYRDLKAETITDVDDDQIQDAEVVE